MGACPCFTPSGLYMGECYSDQAMAVPVSLVSLNKLHSKPKWASVHSFPQKTIKKIFT